MRTSCFLVWVGFVCLGVLGFFLWGFVFGFWVFFSNEHYTFNDVFWFSVFRIFFDAPGFEISMFVLLVFAL